MSASKPGNAPMPAPGRRQRRHARYRAEFPVSLTILAGTGYQTLEAHCKDLSQAGIGLLVASELTQGEVFALKFSLPASDVQWEIRAVLRHRRGYHYGFEFISISRECGEAIRDYIQTLERTD
jgi:c-di-GMP-binding flagellar brake protein YcgR